MATTKTKSVKRQTGRKPAEAAPSSQKSADQLAIEMRDFSWQWVRVTLVGETPLLTNAFSEATMDEIEKEMVNPSVY